MIFFIDNDSTLMKEETFDELFRIFGDDFYNKVLEKTHESMNSMSLSLEESLQFRIKTLLEQDIKITKTIISEFAYQNYNFSDGVEIFLQTIIAKFGTLKNRVFILSGGFEECIFPKLQTLNIEESEKKNLFRQCIMNRFLWNNEEVLIGIDWENSKMWEAGAKRKAILDLHKKGMLLNESWIAIGDGSNDIGMIESEEEGEFFAFTGAVRREKTVIAAQGKELKSFTELLLMLKN